MTEQRYISKELIHFVGRHLDQEAQYRLLLKILKDKVLLAPPSLPNVETDIFLNFNSNLSDNEMLLPQIVCFCDIPVSYLSIHIKKYSPFGISFDKDFIVKNGGCPVQYIPEDAIIKIPQFYDMHDNIRNVKINNAKSSKDIWELLKEIYPISEYYNKMAENIFSQKLSIISILQKAFNKREAIEFPYFLMRILSYLKFYNHKLPDDHPDNYYFEREWRIIGDLHFNLENIKTIFIPENYSTKFRLDYPKYAGQLILISS